MNLYSPVSVIKNIGPKYKKYLERLGIFTVNDLIYHFPFRYDDFSEVVNTTDVIENQTVTVRGVLSQVNNIYTRYGKRLTKAVLSDTYGNINVIWFNQHYLKKMLIPDKNFTLSGKVSLFDRKPALIGPEVEETDMYNLNTGRLVPVYPETFGVSSRWLRTRINDILTQNDREHFIKEFIPEDILNKYLLYGLEKSLKEIHFPSNPALVEDARKRLIFEELFLELINVEVRKADWTKNHLGYPMKLYTTEIESFIKTLPYKLTDTQNTGLTDIFADLEKSAPMNRLLEGDVGSGKTVVAVITAYLTYLNGYKTLYMAPTEILANQHYATFVSLLAKTGAKIKLLTSTTENSVKRSEEDWDIVVGTHAILYTTTTYQKIGLVVIDEQHRFGVEQRGKIVELGKNKFVPNILTMTATPIPRTLALTLYGDLDLSHLDISADRKRDIVTKIVPDSKREEIYKWISEKEAPTFIICPFIEDSSNDSLENVKSAQSEFVKLKNGWLKNKKIGLLHGRLKSAEKQQVIDDFKQGVIQVLVSTPVVEVGIDIPEAAVIVIESGERYGLASLHQLRGRVGRTGQQGFCFVVMSNYSKFAYSRLKNLETVGEGLKLAEIDMKIRGQGNIFSTMQHGFKKFKIANFDNLLLVEQAKISAERIFPELNAYPELKNKIDCQSGKYVKNN